jgi:uncharacterized phage infection (PIP) family protein YhgE
MAVSWNQTKAAALKVLGKGGKLTKERVDISASIIKFNKIFAGFNTGREDLEKKLIELKDGADSLKNAVKQYSDLVDSDDFGLDSDKEEDKAKIKQAQKILLDAIEEIGDGVTDYDQELDTLDRALTDLRRLKGLQI